VPKTRRKEKNIRMNLGVRAPVFFNIGKKCYLKISKKNERKIFLCSYYVDNYLCKFSRKNTIVCGVNEYDKISK
jgi:hypothetical protein